MSLSNILDNDGRIEIGLNFFLLKASPFLSIDDMLPFLRVSGKLLVSMHKLKLF